MIFTNRKGECVMEDNDGIFDNELCVQFSKGSEELTIISREIEKGQWELSMVNEHGISTVWLKYFSTAQQAIDAGIQAIGDEGVEPFSSTEGFEYLHG